MNKEIIELVKKMIEDGNLSQKIAEKYCPELKESEDERIRKELISFFTERAKHTEDSTFNGLSSKEIIAWLEKQGKNNMGISEATKKELEDNLNNALEKETPESCNEFLDEQGEQKPAEEYNITGIGSKNAQGKLGEMIKNIKPVNEVLEQKSAENAEPKFNAGDWVVVNDGRIGRIRECTKDFADVDLEFSCLSTSPNNIRSWTIQDAKDGDILATQDHILIFEKLLPKDGGESYCHYDFGCSKPQFDFNKDSNWYFGKEAKVYPATKEQRDQLEKAMADAGYTFDFDKKELKKIEQKPTEWSEKTKGLDELETYILSIVPNRPLDAIKVDSKNIRFLINKEQKPAWSEEDEYHKRQILRILKDNGCSQTLQERTEKWIEERLKSLRPQSQWMPSDEQMGALWSATEKYLESDDENVRTLRGEVLGSLYNDLKKLETKGGISYDRIRSTDSCSSKVSR